MEEYEEQTPSTKEKSMKHEKHKPFNVILVRKAPNADSRTCDPTTVSMSDLYEASKNHIVDVRTMTKAFAEALLDRVYDSIAPDMTTVPNGHDHDKLRDIEGFHRDFVASKERPFVEGDWYVKHLKVNRHHLEEPEGIPEDVTLIDVIEHVVDAVASGMARSRTPREVRLSGELLQLAVRNTVDKLVASTTVADCRTC